MLFEYGSDLSELDAETADLHLLVGTSQKLQMAVSAVAHQITCTVQQRPRFAAEAIRDKSFRGQFRPSQITPGYAVATDVQFPGRPHRQRLPAFIQHIDSRIRNRTPDGHRRGPFLHFLNLIPSGKGGRLGRPIYM